MNLFNTDYIKLMDNVLDEMKKYKQWVLVPCDSKLPFQTNGKIASIADPATWDTYEACIEELKRDEKWKYLAFAFTKSDPFCFIDVDKINNDNIINNGNLQNTVNFMATYTELSRSGNGLHLIGFGRLESTFWRKYGNIEMYDDNHFLTITGRAAENLDKLRDIGQKCHAIQRKYKKQYKKIEQGECALPISQVYARINRGYWLGLSEGDAPNGDESSADYSLLCKLGELTNYDIAVMEEVFNMTRRGQREKWVTRADYRERTLQSVFRQKGE